MEFSKEQLNSLSINTRAYYDYQGERLRLGNMLGIKKDGEDKKGVPPRDPALLSVLNERYEQLTEVESALEKGITVLISEHPLWINFLDNVKGVGPMMAAVIITEFDIHKAPTASNLTSFAGLAPGKDRKVKGKKCPFNQFLRAKLCGVLGGSFLKSKSVPYSVYYYDYKSRLENSNKMIDELLRKEDKKKKKYAGQKTRLVAWKNAYVGHRHKAATRKMIKMFLQDLYVAWRTLEGLPVREPYCEEYLERKHAA